MPAEIIDTGAFEGGFPGGVIALIQRPAVEWEYPFPVLRLLAVQNAHCAGVEGHGKAFTGLGLISIYFVTDPHMLQYSMIGVGLAWASILAMPYVILSGSIPPGKLGIYMGIFNFFITLPQIINGMFGGSIVKHLYNGQPIYAIVLAGFFMLCAAVSVLFVYDAGASKIKQEKLITV